MCVWLWLNKLKLTPNHCYSKKTASSSRLGFKKGGASSRQVDKTNQFKRLKGETGKNQIWVLKNQFLKRKMKSKESLRNPQSKNTKSFGIKRNFKKMKTLDKPLLLDSLKVAFADLSPTKKKNKCSSSKRLVANKGISDYPSDIKNSSEKKRGKKKSGYSAEKRLYMSRGDNVWLETKSNLKDYSISKNYVTQPKNLFKASNLFKEKFYNGKKLVEEILKKTPGKMLFNKKSSRAAEYDYMTSSRNSSQKFMSVYKKSIIKTSHFLKQSSRSPDRKNEKLGNLLNL